MLYFASDCDRERVVRFEHLRCPPWAEVEAAMRGCTRPAVCELHDKRMEDVAHTAFVNFANADFCYGRFIASATQEEILQMCCPELNVGMLLGTLLFYSGAAPTGVGGEGAQHILHRRYAISWVQSSSFSGEGTK